MTNDTWNRACQVAFIGACLALATTAVLRLTQSDAAGTASLAAQTDPISPGTQLRPIAGVSFADADLTTLLLIHSQCKYCAKSMPFYQRMVQGHPPGRVRIVAVSREPVETLQTFLRERHVEVDAVATIRGPEVPVSATPTIVLVDRRGVVKQSWLGQLTAAQEKDVVRALTSTAVTQVRGS